VAEQNEQSAIAAKTSLYIEAQKKRLAVEAKRNEICIELLFRQENQWSTLWRRSRFFAIFAKRQQ